MFPAFEVYYVSVAQNSKWLISCLTDHRHFNDLNRQNYATEKAVFDVFKKLKIQIFI